MPRRRDVPAGDRDVEKGAEAVAHAALGDLAAAGAHSAAGDRDAVGAGSANAIGIVRRASFSILFYGVRVDIRPEGVDRPAGDVHRIRIYAVSVAAIGLPAGRIDRAAVDGSCEACKYSIASGGVSLSCGRGRAALCRDVAFIDGEVYGGVNPGACRPIIGGHRAARGLDLTAVDAAVAILGVNAVAAEAFSGIAAASVAARGIDLAVGDADAAILSVNAVAVT